MWFESLTYVTESEFNLSSITEIAVILACLETNDLGHVPPAPENGLVGICFYFVLHSAENAAPHVVMTRILDPAEHVQTVAKKKHRFVHVGEATIRFTDRSFRSMV